jgi:hypothetical protein
MAIRYRSAAPSITPVTWAARSEVGARKNNQKKIAVAVFLFNRSTP